MDVYNACNIAYLYMVTPTGSRKHVRIKVAQIPERLYKFYSNEVNIKTRLIILRSLQFAVLEKLKTTLLLKFLMWDLPWKWG
jgi:hypothetical protein